MKLRGIALAAALLHLASAQQNGGLPTPHGYSAAFYTAGGYGQNEQSLTVFPFNGKALSTHLPFALGPFAFIANGTVLYATEGPPAAGAPRRSPMSPKPYRLYKIEFNPMRTRPVAGSAGLAGINSFAVSSLQDKVVASLAFPYFGDVGCGIYELSLMDGTVKKVIDNPECAPGLHGYLSAWSTVSLAPDGKRAVAIRKRRLELIDLTRGTVVSLGGGFAKSTWSPDGKWIAALEDRKEKPRTVLIDTRNFTKRRSLGTSEAEWSPDSRYLLGSQEDESCDYNYGTLEAVDIQTGRRTTIKSSKCKVNEVTAAWVSSEIDTLN